jgi:ribonuclease Y
MGGVWQMAVYVAIGLLGLAAGTTTGYLIKRRVDRINLAAARETAQEILEGAKRDAESKRREAALEIKDEMIRAKAEFEKETRQRRNELLKLEKRMAQKEENLDRKADLVEKKESGLINREKALKEKEDKVAILLEKEEQELQRISGLSREEAKKVLLASLEKEVRQDSEAMVKSIEQEAREIADRKAKEIISLAIQKCAAGHVVETSVSVVPLPNEEMKGRIIGREGRNIRAFEMSTGVDLIIDDTPEAVILSAFDPVRREAAKIALSRLVSDGRIHPTRIEEIVEKVRKELEDSIMEEGRQVVFEMGIPGLHPELVRLLGKLKYRTSYGQNVLVHSREVSYLAEAIAAELKLDSAAVKRAALLHDIGKAVDHEVEGSHAEIGANLAKRYGETPKVVNAIAYHHGPDESRTVEAVIIQSADAISAARPGARRETLENYIKRLEKLEQIAESFAGVNKTYAIQAGREIRVMVDPEAMDDSAARQLAQDLAKKIQEEIKYPGQIKITIIRETRAVEYAR